MNTIKSTQASTSTYQTQTELQMTDNKLEMLSAREQLMSDIECIVESVFWDTWGDEYPDTQNELIKTLCDSVCSNFPSN